MFLSGNLELNGFDHIDLSMGKEICGYLFIFKKI